MIALDEYPIIITITAVRRVFKTTLSFPARYQIYPAIAANTARFSKNESEIIQTPVSNNAPTAKAVFLTLPEVEIVDFIQNNC